MGNIISWSSGNDIITHTDFKTYQTKMNMVIDGLENKINDMQELHDNKNINQKITWLEEHVEQLYSNVSHVNTANKNDLQMKINQLNTVINKLSNNVNDYVDIRQTVRSLETKLRYIEQENINNEQTSDQIETQIDSHTEIDNITSPIQPISININDYSNDINSINSENSIDNKKNFLNSFRSLIKMKNKPKK
jgi:uncharacterized coiled-coil DUF342 family protein